LQINVFFILSMKLLFAIIFATKLAHAAAADLPITQQELVRRTQELYDAIVPGNRTPLEKIFRRRLHLLQRERTHHGQGETGCRHHAYAGGIFRLDQDRQCPEPDFGRHRSSELRRHETETIFGQNLTARYHVTDTWLRRNDEWKIIASQAHRYYEDPAVGKADPRKFGDFIGTYELAPGQIRSITVENENLFIERKGKKEQLLPETSDLFFRKSIEGRILFHYDANGKVDSLADRRNNEDVIWRKIK